MAVKSTVWMVMGLLLVDVVRWCCAQGSKPLEYNLQEQQKSGIFVSNVKRDSNLSHIYTEEDIFRMRFNFRSTSENDRFFRISETEGVIRTTQIIDRERLCPYSDTCVVELDITVTPVKYFRIIKVLVHILDINDHPPQFPKRRVPLDVAENTNPGAVLATYSVEDLDGGDYGVQRFELAWPVSQFALREALHMDGSRDVSLVLQESLDREVEDYYSVAVIAWDGGSPPKSGTITIDISVTDSNDNNPQFDNSTYIIQIAENLPRTRVIVQLHARDPDSGPNGEVVYEFASHTVQAHGETFGINNKTGEIYIKGDVDYEEEKLYHLTVMASDRGPNSLPAFAKVVINVLDVNDHEPQITVNTFNSEGVALVPENTDVGHFVAHVAVTDPDSGNNGLFDCSIDGSLFNLTKIPGVGYKITTKKTFDREEGEKYSIEMSCSDHGIPRRSSSLEIQVTITDANDHSPHFAQPMYYASIRENNPLNKHILLMSALDEDSGQNSAMKYEIKGFAGTPDDVVTIDHISGEIRASEVFDYERKQRYMFVVNASDRGDVPRSTTALVNLTVLDVNDEAPVFSQKVYTIKVKEDQRPDLKEIGYVYAEDQDSYPYNSVTYSLEPYTSDFEKFDIDAKTGLIYATGALDREESEEYHLTVIARNEGYPSIRSTAEVIILIGDINDNAPVFEFPNRINYTVQVPTVLKSGDIIARVKATDSDLGNNSAVTFDILRGNEDSSFKIDHSTGDVVAARNTKFQDKIVKRLVLTARDMGFPKKMAQASLTIVFNQSMPIAGAQESLLSGINLIIVIGAIAGVLLIVIAITIAIFCLKARRRRHKKAHVYNCRVQEQQKSLSNGSVAKDSLSSLGSDTCSDKSIENVNIGSKTKEKSKKEVTFSMDMEEPYIDGIPIRLPQKDPSVIQNHHPHQGNHVAVAPPPPAGPLASAGRGELVIPPAPSRPHPPYPPHHHDRVGMLRRGPAGRGQSPPYPHPHQANNPSQPSPGRPTANGAPITQEDLEMHDMLAISPTNTDHDSESGCSGTDSGRGPSEEGDNYNYNNHHNQMEPFLSPGSRRPIGAPHGFFDPRHSAFRPIYREPDRSFQSETGSHGSVANEGKTAETPSVPQQSHDQESSRQQPRTPAGTVSSPMSSSLQASTPLTSALQNSCRAQRPVECGNRRAPPPEANAYDYNPHSYRPSLPKVPEDRAGNIPRYPSECLHDVNREQHSCAFPKRRSCDGYVPSYHANRLRVSDHPCSNLATPYYSGSDSNLYSSSPYYRGADCNCHGEVYGSWGRLPGARYVGDHHLPHYPQHAGMDAYPHTDAYDDDATTTSGSYVIDHAGDDALHFGMAPGDAFV